LISYARTKGDTYTEELIYNKLIDIYRNPEMIREITDTIIDKKILNTENL